MAELSPCESRVNHNSPVEHNSRTTHNSSIEHNIPIKHNNTAMKYSHNYLSKRFPYTPPDFPLPSTESSSSSPEHPPSVIIQQPESSSFFPTSPTPPMASPRSRKRSATDDGARAPVSKSRKMSAGAQDPIYDIQSLSSPPDNSTDASRLTSLSSISTPASFPSPGLTESARAAAAIRERLRPLLLDNSISLEACRAAMHTEYEKASPEVLRIICPPPAKKYRGAAGIAKLKEEIEKAKETRGVSSQAESIPPGRGHFQPLMRYQAFVSPSPPPTKRPGGEPIKSFEDYPEGTVEPWDDEEVPASMPCPEPDHKWLNGEKRMHIVERMEAAEAAAKEKIVEQVRKEEAPKQKAPKQEKPKEEKEMGRKRKREYVGLNEKGHWAPPAEGSRRIRRQLKEEKDMGRKRKREYVGLNEKGHWAPPAEGSKRIRRQLKRE